MLKGRGAIKLGQGGFEIAIFSEQNWSSVYTFEIKHHVIERSPVAIIPTTIVPFDQEEMLRAFAEALVELGIIKDTATQKELKATQYHLEDMRKIAFEPSTITNVESR